MAMKRVPLFVLVLLGTAATFPGVAIAEEEDSRCQVQMCAAGITTGSQCRTTEEAWNCNDRCTSLGCDGGTQVGDAFGCIAGLSSQPFILCQCSYCGTGGGGGTGGSGGGGGGGGCSDCLCDDWACDDECWWEGWDWGGCYHGECWCHADMN